MGGMPQFKNIFLSYLAYKFTIQYTGLKEKNITFLGPSLAHSNEISKLNYIMF